MNSVGHFVALSLKFACTANEVLQSRGREFCDTGIEHLTKGWQKCIENDEVFEEK
jgi:hypothetical protein